MCQGSNVPSRRVARARGLWKIGVDQAVAGQSVARARVVVVSGAENVRHDAVEEAEAVPGVGPLARLVRIHDVTLVHDQRDLLVLSLPDDPLDLGAEDLRMGGRVVLRVG
jgi:hypothetical protein